MRPSFSSTQVQTQVLAPQLRQGLRILTMGIADLRSEIRREVSANPALDMEDDDSLYAVPEGLSSASVEDMGDEPFELTYRDDRPSSSADSEAEERRERFFANQTVSESLEEHLLRQVAVSDVPSDDRALVEILIGELDEDGYFRESLPAIAKITGTSVAKLKELLRSISRFDPPGCGATDLKECLLAQLDSIHDLDLRQRVHHLLLNLSDISSVKKADRRTLAALRMLNPRPGGAFRSSRYDSPYICPEVMAVPDGNGYKAVVDERWIPVLHVSNHYLSMMENPSTDEETRAYVRERVAAARTLISAVDHRHETIAAIAQAIFDAQPDFFKGGMLALRPLTMTQVAERVGMHRTTVSRTVRGKYVSTEKGTFELRKFFSNRIMTDSGDNASATTVRLLVRDLVESEDLSSPLTDDMIVELLRTQGFNIARRTVAKYRKGLGIPSVWKRTLPSRRRPQS